MRVAIVTGAGSGIGRATAVKLGAMGFAVAVVARTKATLEETAALVRKTGAEAFVISADCSKSTAVQKMVAEAIAKWGRIDVLINNAGVAPMNPIAQVSDDEWDEVLAVNVSSAFYATRAVWPWMEKSGGGVIVNVSSMAAKDPFAGLGAYAIAKVGVNMLTLVTAREGKAVGIRVHCVGPGATDTPMLQRVLGDVKMDASQMMQPEEIAAVIGDMVAGSPKYASGETIYVHR